jgi:hypothetical protein
VALVGHRDREPTGGHHYPHVSGHTRNLLRLQALPVHGARIAGFQQSAPETPGLRHYVSGNGAAANRGVI